MIRRFGFATILILALSSAVHAQVIIDSDVRLFTTMTAINAAGFDVELGDQYHPVRAVARNLAKQLDPDLIARLKDFYQAHKQGETDDAQLAKYISLAVNLSAAPDFKLALREELLPPAAREVKDFAPLLKEVYAKAKISNQWVYLASQYDAEINRLGPLIREELVRTDAYLRVPSGANGARSMDILVELAAPINSVNVQSDQDSYFVVLGQSTTSRLDDIRHAYLHYQLDNLVASNSKRVVNGPSLLQLVNGVKGVQAAYTRDFNYMMTESLIRAIEIRMDKTVAVRARETVDSYYRAGLLLIPYFYNALLKYEADQVSFHDLFAGMLVDLNVSDETGRFSGTFMAILPSQKAMTLAEVPLPEPIPEANPMRDLLKEGEAALNAKNYDKAKTAFDKVLSDYDRNNGAALYGLGLVASRNGDHDQAKDYFERTTRNETVVPSMKVWAYIYLARIFDLDCQRERALEYYQQAIKLGDNTSNAQAAAQDGTKKPYGDSCG